MAVDLQNIRLMNTTKKKVGKILRTDVLYKKEDWFCEIGTCIIKNGNEIVV